MDIRINEWAKLKFCDPAIALPELRKLQVRVAVSNLPDKIKNLRTNKLKHHEEKRIAAIFSYGMGKYLNKSIYFAPAPHKNLDYDVVMKRIERDIEYYTPVQIKEVVPENLNSDTDINQEIAKLATRYPVSNEVVVVMNVNRERRLELSSIKVPKLSISGLWLVGASRSDQSKWCIAGNLLDNPEMFEFDYPV